MIPTSIKVLKVAIFRLQYLANFSTIVNALFDKRNYKFERRIDFELGSSELELYLNVEKVSSFVFLTLTDILETSRREIILTTYRMK